MAISDIVQDEIDKRVNAAIDTVNKRQTQVQEYENAVLTQQRQYNADLIGFQTGAVAPKYVTENADVSVRDPYINNPGSAPQLIKKKGLSGMAMLAIAGAVYFIFFKKKRSFRK
jgi:hypothetical protein